MYPPSSSCFSSIYKFALFLARRLSAHTKLTEKNVTPEVVEWSDDRSERDHAE
jgi:hypothetical protein